MCSEPLFKEELFDFSQQKLTVDHGEAGRKGGADPSLLSVWSLFPPWVGELSQTPQV